MREIILYISGQKPRAKASIGFMRKRIYPILRIWFFLRFAIPVVVIPSVAMPEQGLDWCRDVGALTEME